MIAELEVRRMLASYEQKLREEIADTREHIQTMEDSCRTVEMERIWRESNEYIELHTRLATLRNVISNIIDMRCSKILEEAE